MGFDCYGCMLMYRVKRYIESFVFFYTIKSTNDLIKITAHRILLIHANSSRMFYLAFTAIVNSPLVVYLD